MHESCHFHCLQCVKQSQCFPESPFAFSSSIPQDYYHGSFSWASSFVRRSRNIDSTSQSEPRVSSQCFTYTFCALNTCDSIWTVIYTLLGYGYVYDWTSRLAPWRLFVFLNEADAESQISYSTSYFSLNSTFHVAACHQPRLERSSVRIQNGNLL